MTREIPSNCGTLVKWGFAAVWVILIGVGVWLALSEMYPTTYDLYNMEESSGALLPPYDLA